MSRSFWGGGRYSPFAHAGGPPPRVEPEDYQYIVDDEADPRAYGNGPRHNSYGFPPTHRHPSRAEPPDLEPDVLILKHKGATYPLHFQAFDISEGNLKVGDLRRTAAKELKVDDPRRVKLLYKGKSLREDRHACKEEGLKQNSELLCVVSADPYPRADDDGNESSSSATSSDMLANGLDPAGSGPRVDVDGTILDRVGGEPRKRKGHRAGRRKKPRDSPIISPRASSGYLAPSNGSSVPSSIPHNPSPAPPSSRPIQSSSSAAAAAPSSQQPPKKPSTPAEALAMIADTFHTTFLPQVRAFMQHPPKEEKSRDFEYKKLSESILTQVIMKLDGVETEGNEGLRAKRKELVRETQGWLNDLDRMMGKRS